MRRGFKVLARVSVRMASLAWLSVIGFTPSLSSQETCDADMPSLVNEDNDVLLAIGQEVYGRCKGCHSFGFNRVGPDHCGLAGRKAGQAPGYRYSNALKSANIVWTYETLDNFLFDPRRMVPGTMMTYAGVKDDQDRYALVTYILHTSLDAEVCK